MIDLYKHLFSPSKVVPVAISLLYDPDRDSSSIRLCSLAVFHTFPRDWISTILTILPTIRYLMASIRMLGARLTTFRLCCARLLPMRYYSAPLSPHLVYTTLGPLPLSQSYRVLWHVVRSSHVVKPEPPSGFYSRPLILTSLSSRPPSARRAPMICSVFCNLQPQFPS